MPDIAKAPFSLRALAFYFLKLGTIGFGGPVALVGYMNRDLVLEREWYTPEEYSRGLAFSQLSPGPVAAQLAMYLGFIRSGIVGASIIAFVFILPSFLMVLALGAFYMAYGDLAWVSAAFYGIGPAVIAVIARSSYKLARAMLKKEVLGWAIFIAVIPITVWLGGASLWMFIVGGLIGLAFTYRKSVAIAFAPLLSVPLVLGADRSLPTIFLYFFKAGFIVFGSGLAIVPFLRGGVVLDHHWMTDHQFVDAVAVAMVTPGPAVITVAFIGYFVRGIAGAAMAALGVFLPVFLFVVIGAPIFERHAANDHLKAFVGGVTAAAVGSMAGAVLLLGHTSILDVRTALIFLIAFGFSMWSRIPDVILIFGAAIVGLFLHNLI
jgi:chromate transporter